MRSAKNTRKPLPFQLTGKLAEDLLTQFKEAVKEIQRSKKNGIPPRNWYLEDIKDYKLKQDIWRSKKDNPSKTVYWNSIIGDVDKLTLGVGLGQGLQGIVQELNGAEIPLVIKFCILNKSNEKYTGTLSALTNGAEDETSFERAHKLAQNERYFMLEMEEEADKDNIMPLYGAFECLKSNEYSYGFLIMPKYETVDNLLSRIHDTKTVAQLLYQIASALQCCEKHSIYHRDVKLNNIFSRNEGGNYTYMLGDFGIAVRYEEINDALSVRTELAAPEVVIFNDYYPNSDIFSLGANIARELGILAQEESYQRIDSDLNKIIEKMCEEEHLERYASAGDVKNEIMRRVMPKFVTITDSVDEKAIITENADAHSINKYVEQCMNAVKNAEISASGLQAAIAIAEEGAGNGNAACAKMLSWLYFLLYKNENANTETSNEYLEKAMDSVSELCLEGDISALAINNILMYSSRSTDTKINSKEFAELMKPLADANCAIAQYWYGKLLFHGSSSYPEIKDSHLGAYYVRAAVENGYLEAADYLRRVGEKFPALWNYKELHGYRRADESFFDQRAIRLGVLRTL